MDINELLAQRVALQEVLKSFNYHYASKCGYKLVLRVIVDEDKKIVPIMEGYNKPTHGIAPWRKIRVQYAGKYYKELLAHYVDWDATGLDKPIGWKYI